MGHHDKKVYDSLPFKNKAIDTITITGFNPDIQYKIPVGTLTPDYKKLKKDLNKKEQSKVFFHGWPSEMNKNKKK